MDKGTVVQYRKYANRKIIKNIRQNLSAALSAFLKGSLDFFKTGYLKLSETLSAVDKERNKYYKSGNVVCIRQFSNKSKYERDKEAYVNFIKSDRFTQVLSFVYLSSLSSFGLSAACLFTSLFSDLDFEIKKSLLNFLPTYLEYSGALTAASLFLLIITPYYQDLERVSPQKPPTRIS